MLIDQVVEYLISEICKGVMWAKVNILVFFNLLFEVDFWLSFFRSGFYFSSKIKVKISTF